MNGTKQKLDLNKVRDIIFKDLFLLLNDLELDYQIKNNNVFMRCPIHHGDNDNGVSISLTHKNWRCWTRSCHEDSSTNIFGFIQSIFTERSQDASFSDVLRYVCKLYKIRETEPKKEKIEDPYEDFSEIVKIFKHNSHSKDIIIEDVKTCGNSPYFESRGFYTNTLKHFGVEDCLEKNSVMSNRSIIPVFYREEKVGFIARATKSWQTPKYLFSDGFKKANYLYNYDKALDRSLETATLFLVEGQGDVWRMYEAGVTNCVGLFGKDISSRQKDLLLKSGATKIVVLTDNDQAGRESKIKIQRELFRSFNLKFPKIVGKDIGDMSIESIQQNILYDLKGSY
jgi:5S rRNA maturation endonuclease (ribonuclease M5)